MKIHLKTSSAKWRPFCPVGDELISNAMTLQIHFAEAIVMIVIVIALFVTTCRVQMKSAARQRDIEAGMRARRQKNAFRRNMQNMQNLRRASRAERAQIKRACSARRSSPEPEPTTSTNISDSDITPGQSYGTGEHTAGEAWL